MKILAQLPLALATLWLLTTGCGQNADSGDPLPPALGAGEGGTLPEACAGLRCSANLRDVLDGCTGAVVQSCAVDQGCGNGQCVAACDAVALSQGSVGCDFFAMPPDDDSMAGKAAGCYAAFVANTWEEPVHISASYAGTSLDITGSTYLAPFGEGGLVPAKGALEPGQVAVILLSHAFGVNCPGVPALNYDPIFHGTSLTRAMRISTDRPVSAYSIYPYAAAFADITAATLLLPVSSWAKQYVAISPWNGAYNIDNEYTLRPAHPFLQVIAAEPDTEVRLRPIADLSAGSGIAPVPVGAVGTWTLGQGEVLQIKQFQELTGSTLESTKPIGLFGGTESTYVPSEVTRFSDILDQQIPPPSQWGREYAGVPAVSRLVGEESVLYRVVAAANDTQLSYESAEVRPPSAPRSLSAGQAAYFETSHPFVVRSQDDLHPIYAAVYMKGADTISEDSTSEGGDPDVVNLVPTGQYLDRYVFYMDYTYRNSSITVSRRRGPNGFSPVVLDCAGELGDFRPLDEAGQYEYTYVKLTRGGARQSFGTGVCGTGRHEIKSDGLFAVYVWGTDLDVSYGYPGGMGLRPISPFRLEVR